MTQPIGGYRPLPGSLGTFDDPIGHAAQGFCKHADTVTAGYLCDEPTVVSSACRSPRNDLDRFVCDDRNLAAAQRSIPYAGPTVLVLGSSVAYYAWRGRYPEAARRLNRHAWIAIGLNIVLVLVVRRLGRP